MRPILRLLIWPLAAVLLCQCGVPAPPTCRRLPVASRGAAASLLEEARASWAVLADGRRRDDWPLARKRYNHAVARLFDRLRCGADDWQVRSTAMGTRIAAAGPVHADIGKLDALFPASQVDARVVRSRKTADGVGVPLVGWIKTAPVGRRRDRFLLPNGLPYNISAMLAFDGKGPPEWRFIKRWNHDEVRIGGASHPLAADWTAPNAFFWRMCELDNLKLQNVLVPDRFIEESGVYFITPYDPEKIPLVFVHGLVSSPDAFKNMINELIPEPWFRERYQIWLYNYPTGNPWIYSSMRFRELMREACGHARARGHDRNLNRMVVVAHSMGGLLTRSSVTDPGNGFYDTHFKVPLDDTPFTRETRGFIRDVVLYEPLEEPERVVFLAVPHRGSPLANAGPALWISKFIRLPKILTVELLDNTLEGVGDVLRGGDPSQRMPTSINSLSPSNPATRALDRLGLPRDITFHSVIGDRGRGDTPASSDGVVPYWSSHVSPVASEKIVPSNHGVPDCPQAALELKRILRLHLGGR